MTDKEVTHRHEEGLTIMLVRSDWYSPQSLCSHLDPVFMLLARVVVGGNELEPDPSWRTVQQSFEPWDFDAKDKINEQGSFLQQIRHSHLSSELHNP